MPYVDILNDLSLEDLTESAGAAQFGTIVDISADDSGKWWVTKDNGRRQVGIGTPIQVHVQIETTPVVADTNEMSLTLETSDNANMSSSVVLHTFLPTGSTPLAAGTTLLFTLPGSGLRKYLAIKATPAATKAFTAGEIKAFLEPHIG